MKFCSECGEKVNQVVPEGDNRPRFVCQSCDTIHYQNPKIVTGCIAEWQDSILLCKRAIEPRHGYWTLPAGFMENGETNLEGAARETEEEANAQLQNMQLFCVFSIPHISQVYTMYRGDLVEGLASPGIESLEVALVEEANIPWEDMAFRVVTETLKLYYRDKEQGLLKQGSCETHYGDIRKQDDGSLIVHLY